MSLCLCLKAYALKNKLNVKSGDDHGCATAWAKMLHTSGNKGPLAWRNLLFALVDNLLNKAIATDQVWYIKQDLQHDLREMCDSVPREAYPRRKYGGKDG
ncbi:hypothetical protein F2Q69_00020438 [Brassica cretica]|uniref:Uncharacterized protein n=1 Tax=Brassica cretica TaxID=69181 RepID=A0A8S9QK63_BRACR|nr:hypothetical protein F2Q69_00020438 [Brassica cretica]